MRVRTDFIGRQEHRRGLARNSDMIGEGDITGDISRGTPSGWSSGSVRPIRAER